MTNLITLFFASALATAPPGAATGGRSFVQDWWYPEFGGRGPTGWENTYEECGADDQSPIDIRAIFTKENVDLGPLVLTYPEVYRGYSTVHAQSVAMLRFHETETTQLTANYPKAASYHLEEIQFRTPAEHLISGVRHEMEVQLIHKEKSTGKLLAVSLLYEEGGGRLTWFDAILDELPKPPVNGFPYYNRPTTSFTESVKTIVQEEFNVAAIYPGRRDYYVYTGGMTSPPCERNVTWFVMKETGRVTTAQLNKLRSVLQVTAERGFLTAAGNAAAANGYIGNVRPVQPLGSRTVYSYADIKTKIDHTDLDSLRLPTVGAIVGICTFIGVAFNLITIAMT